MAQEPFKPSRLTSDELSDLLTEIAIRCDNASKALTEAESEFRYLEDMEKIVFDNAMPAPMDKVSIRDREREARISEEFAVHIDALKEARAKHLQARYNYLNEVRRHDDINSILLKRFGSMS